ncbi:hypothetical protein X975_11676, partial [Stegodyphus mimosarum]
MGSDRGTGTRLAARFCYGACFGLGFVITAITLAAMFWIVWCYFGLAVLQISDSQRRALVNYSHVPSKPSPTPVTASPSRATTLPSIETSVNSISKSPTVATVLRGSSRELSPAATASPQAPPRVREDDIAEKVGQKAAILSGDESSKEATNEEVIYARRVSSSTTENRPIGPDRKEDKVKSPGRRNPPDSGIEPRLDIAPTQVYDSKNARSRRPLDEESDKPTRDEKRSPPVDYIEKDRPASAKRDEIQSSRRPDDIPPYRDPDFERDYPRRPPLIVDRERSRYDDDDDTRGTRSRYDKRDRGRESDDRYSKGDTRVYPDDDLKIPLEKERTDRPIPRSDDRYRDRLAEDDRYRTRDDRYDDRYPDETRRRGDDDRYRDRDYDDRYRDRDERYRYRSVEERERYRDRIPEERYKPIDDKDIDRYRTREDRYRYRDEERYRDRDDDRYRTRDDDTELRDRISEDKLKDRDYDSLSRDVSYRPRIDDDRYREEEEVRRRNKDYKEPAVVSRIDEIPLIERRPLPVRSETSSRDTRRRADYEPDVIDRPRSYARDDVVISRAEIPVRSISSEDRYVARDKDDDYRRPSRIDERDDKIVPTRVRDDEYISRSSLIDDRSRDEVYVPRPPAIDLKPRDETRFSDERKESRLRDDKYYDDDDRIRRLDDSRSTLSSLSSASGTRKLTRGDIPEEKRVDAKYVDRDDEVKLDRRSYASEDDDEYRRSNSRTRIPYDYTDRDRRPTDERDYKDDERYIRRVSSADDEYRRDRTRTDYDTDRPRSRDRYDDEYRRYDRDDDRYVPLDRSSSRKAETYPLDDDERYRRRELDERGIRREVPIRDASDDRRRPTRPERLDDRPRKSEPDVRPALLADDRRFVDSIPVSRNRDLVDAYPSPSSSDSSRKPPPRLVSSARDPLLSSSMSTAYSREPSDVIIREKRYQNSQSREKQSRNSESSRVRGELGTINSDKIMPGSKDTALSSEDSEERPLTAKDVIEAALRQSDVSSQNSRKVFYPVFDPRISNLTSPEIIRPSERRGTTITA